jgi:hypothetical protein
VVSLVPLSSNQPKADLPVVKPPDLRGVVLPGPQFEPNSLVVPLARLTPYGLINHQFKDYGLLIEEAVALYPSNPAFRDQPDRLHLMPMSHHCRLRLVLQRRFTAVELHLRGFRGFRVDVLDRHGHRLAVAMHHQPYREQSGAAPEARLRLDTSLAQQLLVMSASAFLLGGIHLFPYPDSYN